MLLSNDLLKYSCSVNELRIPIYINDKYTVLISCHETLSVIFYGKLKLPLCDKLVKNQF